MLAHVTSERSPKWASQNLVKYKDCLQMLEVLSFLSFFFYGVDTNWPLPPSHQSYNQAKAEDLDAGKKQQELMIYPQHKVQGFSRKGWFPRKSGTSFCLPFLAGESLAPRSCRGSQCHQVQGRQFWTVLRWRSRVSAIRNLGQLRLHMDITMVINPHKLEHRPWDCTSKKYTSW